jgi:hypothetical protein
VLNKPAVALLEMPQFVSEEGEQWEKMGVQHFRPNDTGVEVLAIELPPECRVADDELLGRRGGAVDGRLG